MRGRIKRKWLAATAAVVVLVLAMFSLPVFVAWKARAGLKEALKRASAAGLPTTTAELEAGYRRSPSDSSELYKVALPPPPHLRGHPRENTVQLITGKGRLSPKEMDEALRLLSQNYAAIEKATALPDFTPRRDWATLYAADERAHRQMKQWMALLAVRARFRRQQGDLQGATEDVNRMLVICKHLQSERVPVAVHLGAVLQRQLLESLGQLASEADEHCLDTLITRASTLNEVDARPALGFELVRERQLIDALRSGRLQIPNWKLPPWEASPSPQAPTLRTSYYRAGADQAELICITHIVDVAEAWPEVNAVDKLTKSFWRANGGSTVEPGKMLATRIVAGETSLLRAACAETASVRSARIGLAAVRHRVETGRWPSLREAAGEAGVSDLDPFSGSKLIYRPSAKSLAVYSVGQDLIDDGGRVQSSGISRCDQGVFTVILR
jgi:hypothetical protein